MTQTQEIKNWLSDAPVLALLACMAAWIGSGVPLAKGDDAATQGLKIATQSDESNNGFQGESSTMEMVLINAHGDRIVRKMNSMTKETSGDGDKSVVEFLWPADVKGTRMLTWTHKTGDDDQWLFLPALKRVKRISARSKTGSFMGSEFAYEDLGSQEIEKYTYKFIRDGKDGGRESWVLERIPVDKLSGYSRQLVWMDKEYLNPTKIEYYDRKNELLKTASFTHYKKYNEWWRAGKISMINHQTQKKSELVWSDRKIGLKMKDRDFHKKSLKN